MFKRHSDTKLFLAEDESGACVIAFYLLKDNRDSETSDPENIDLQESWESCAGYYLFFNIKEIPEDRDKFEKAITSFLTKKMMGQGPAHTGFLWLIYDGAIIEKEIDAIETRTDETDEENPKVVMTKEKLLYFGGYQLPFGKDTPVVFEEDDASYTGFIFQYPPHPPNLCPSDTDPPAPSDGVHLTFIGPRRGCFECKCLIGDYYSQECTSWNVGIRYAIEVGEEGLAQQFYPIFDLRDGRRPLLNMCWDLADQLNPDRTFLEFLSKSVELVPDGDEACKFKLKIPDHPEVIPSYFRTVTGEVIGLVPQRESAPPARLVFEIWERKDPPARSRYYLAPSGKFELVLIEVDEEDGFTFTPITSEQNKAEFPGRFMCGLSGLESIQFMPRDEGEDDDSEGEGTSIPGDSIVFFPRKPAYVPVFPVIKLDDAQLQLSNNLDLIQQKYLTSWIGFSSSQGTSAYFSQPEAAPLYTSEDNDTDDPLLTLFEPVAAALAESSAERCFPIAPLSGATPITGAPEPRITFLRSFESQIIGPWRREVIRQLFNQGAPDATGGAEVPAVTPQGLRAKVNVDRETPLKLGEIVKAEGWSELLLARPSGTDNTLKFSNLAPTLQAAFQSNQLFLVATKGTHFRGFASKVNIGAWEFDLHPDKNSSNIIIFKFSPGKLRERLRDPRSWTNPSAFNNTAGSALTDLAKRLSDFIGEVDAIFRDDNENESEDDRKKRENKKPDYKPLRDILNDVNWTGILGLNVFINAQKLPTELKALSAGIDPEEFAAKYLAIETGTIEYIQSSLLEEEECPLELEECSLFGLIDYKKDEAAPKPPDQVEVADFTVNRLRAVFRNGDLTEFTCDAQLVIAKLFEYNIDPVKKITLIVNRERSEGRDAYSMVIEGDRSDPAKLKDSPAIESVEMKKAGLQVTEDYVDEIDETFVSVTFSFSGALSFLKLGNGDFDIFSYNTLPYSGLIVRMEFMDSMPAERTLNIDLSAFSLDGNPTAAVARENSLVKKFPMKLQRFYSALSPDTPAKIIDTAPVKDGYIPVTTTTIESGLLAKQVYGLDFTLNLGTLGEFASNAGINVNLLLAWSTEKQVGVFLKFPGMSAGSTYLFSLQGVVKFGASSYKLVYYKDARAWLLMLNEIALRILGVAFPTGAKTNLYIFGPLDVEGQAPQNAIETPLGWYAAYKGVTRK
jgi:hypothetical protein